MFPRFAKVSQQDKPSQVGHITGNRIRYSNSVTVKPRNICVTDRAAARQILVIQCNIPRNDTRTLIDVRLHQDSYSCASATMLEAS